MSVIDDEYPPGSTNWVPGRGDYGTDHSADLIEIIEEFNCIKGCVHSGTAADREEFGPGGNCHILATVAIGDGETPIPELDPREEGPHCRKRVEPPPPPPPEPVPLPEPVGMEPLFDIATPDSAPETP